jgi:hypothetical protein
MQKRASVRLFEAAWECKKQNYRPPISAFRKTGLVK